MQDIEVTIKDIENGFSYVFYINSKQTLLDFRDKVQAKANISLDDNRLLWFDDWLETNEVYRKNLVDCFVAKDKLIQFIAKPNPHLKNNRLSGNQHGSFQSVMRKDNCVISEVKKVTWSSKIYI